MKKNKLQTAVAGLVFILILGAYGAWKMGSHFTQSVNKSIDSPNVGIEYKKVALNSASGTHIIGWLFDAGKDMPSIAVFHGLGSNKGVMLERTQFLVEAGFNVLLIDFRGHGESLADQITFGAKESLDVDAAVRYLRQAYPGKKVGVIGISMGGAASLLGDSPADIDALVLEGVYSTIEQAIRNRMDILTGLFSPVVTPVLTLQLKPRLGVEAGELDPVKAIGQFKRPIYIIGGDQDRKTLPFETQALYDMANEPKTLWMVKGAKHGNLHRYAGETYETNILNFFSRYLIEPNL